MRLTLSYIFLGLSVICFSFAMFMNIKEDANYVFSFRFYLLLISILILIFMTLNNIIKNKKSNGAKLTGKNNIAA
jgi:hypothetical protein